MGWKHDPGQGSQGLRAHRPSSGSPRLIVCQKVRVGGRLGRANRHVGPSAGCGPDILGYRLFAVTGYITRRERGVMGSPPRLRCGKSAAIGTGGGGGRRACCCWLPTWCGCTLSARWVQVGERALTDQGCAENGPDATSSTKADGLCYGKIRRARAAKMAAQKNSTRTPDIGAIRLRVTDVVGRTNRQRGHRCRRPRRRLAVLSAEGRAGLSGNDIR